MCDRINELICQLADQFSVLPQVRAVALGGSRAKHIDVADSQSDIDLYVYTTYEVSMDERLSIVDSTGGASQSNLGLDYWGPGDEWYHAPSGIEVDIVYFDANWMQDQINKVLLRFEPSMGYSTCFWHTINQSKIYYDGRDWLNELQKRCRIPYPEQLRRNIIELNYPVLRGIIPAYSHQVEKAVRRGDLVSINHRLAAFFTSYFDILFAINRLPHPGEKRMLEVATQQCSLQPVDLRQEVESILTKSMIDISVLPDRMNSLMNHLDELLAKEGFIN